MPKNLPNKNFQLAPGIIHIIVILIPLAIVAFLVITNFLPFGKNHSALAQVGEKAPAFSLIDFHGNQVNIDDLKGKPIVMVFWDSRCLACLEELVTLERIKNDFPNVNFSGIHVNNSSLENPKRARFIIENNLKITFSQLEDIDGKVYYTYKFDGTDPVTYFIDKNGIVTERFSGVKTEAEIASQIQKLIQ